MNKQCVNCPGRTDHTTAECPIRAQQKMDQERARVVDAMCMTWRHDFGLDKREHEFGSCGMTEDERCSLRLQMGQLYDHHIAHITARSLPVGVPDGWWQIIHDTLRNYRMSTLDDGYGGGYPLIDALTADGQPVSGGIEECTYLADAIWNAISAAPAAQPAADHSQRALIRHAMNLLNLRNHVPGSDVDICVQDLRKLLDGQPVTTPPPSEAWREVAEIAQTEASAVVNQQVTTAACLWKRGQDSGFYETGCGQTWHFTDGTTPEENSAYFCHHCGKSLEVQRLIAYQVGDNDIVAAYDPLGAIEVLCTYNGYELDEFTVDEVVAVSDALLDSTEAFDQDEGKTAPLEKTLRQELEELTEPAYLHGWE